jgi:hypothetical protein
LFSGSPGYNQNPAKKVTPLVNLLVALEQNALFFNRYRLA